jgi:glucose-6-phosphate-specific signal transduction histidine kinase
MLGFCKIHNYSMRYLKASSQFLFEIIFSAALYMAFFYFNQTITTPLEHDKGVNWIFLPAGLRIFLTLILDYSGAIGLALASLLINYIGFYELDFTSTLGIAVICGVAPLLGRHFVINNLKVQPDLSNISMGQLLIIIIAYSLLSSGLHQFWFAASDLDSGSWNHFIAMFCGDVAGSILFVAVIKYGIDLVKGRLGRNNLIE